MQEECQVPILKAMNKTRCLLVGCQLLLLTVCVSGYSAGAATIACNDRDMKPKHGGGVSDQNEGSFKIRLQTTEYDPTRGDIVSVKINSSSGTPFKGFLIQARKYGSFDYVAKGKMNGPTSLSSRICGSSGNGMTHTDVFSNNWSSEISLSWRPLDDVCESIKMGDLRFQATVVKSFSEKAQIKIYSDEILRMKNVTDPNIIQMCKDRANSSSRITISLYLGALTLFLLRL